MKPTDHLREAATLSYLIARDATTEPQLRTWHAEQLRLESEVTARELPAACSSGCAHCCHQAVAALPWEVVLAAGSITDWDRVQAIAAVVRRLSNTDRCAERVPCPLLVESRCSIYAVRPAACRGENSTSAAACEKASESHAMSALRYVTPKTVLAGAMHAFRERGLDTDPVEFVLALDALRGVERLVERWLDGERLFPSECRISLKRQGGLVQVRLGARRVM